MLMVTKHLFFGSGFSDENPEQHTSQKEKLHQMLWDTFWRYGHVYLPEFIELNAKQYPPPPGYQEPSMTRSPFSALTVAVPSPTTMAWKNIYGESEISKPIKIVFFSFLLLSYLFITFLPSHVLLSFVPYDRASVKCNKSISNLNIMFFLIGFNTVPALKIVMPWILILTIEYCASWEWDLFKSVIYLLSLHDYLIINVLFPFFIVEAHLFFLVYNIPNDRSMMSNVSRFNNCNTIPIANKVLILTCVWIQFFKSTISQASFLLCLELLQRAKLQLYIKARQIADLN